MTTIKLIIKHKRVFIHTFVVYSLIYASVTSLLILRLQEQLFNEDFINTNLMLMSFFSTQRAIKEVRSKESTIT